jgi:phage-related baseplate assembly protein
VQENVDATGAPRMGNFVVTVDDGSGNPSSALLTTVQTAIDAIRPIGSTFSIQSPVVLTVGVSLTVILSPGINKAPVQAQVGAAIADYINGLSIGTMLPLSRIVQIAFAANAAIANVIQVFANGAPSDIDPGITGVLKAGIIAVD